MGLPMTTSNWIGVTASQTESGHPIAVMGPQTGYYNPQLLWEAAVVSHGCTPYELAARGITTVNLPYIVIGHGLDFAWSPTSASSHFTDPRPDERRVGKASVCTGRSRWAHAHTIKKCSNPE